MCVLGPTVKETGGGRDSSHTRLPRLMGLLRRSTRVELLVCPGAGVQGVLPWYRPKKNGERLLIVCIPSDLYTPTASLSTVPHSGTRC